MKKYKYNINNLDCANCARKVEEGLNKCEYLNNVVVNFSTSTISYETDSEVSINNINKLVKEIEPEATVSEINEEHLTKEYHLSLLIIGLLLGLLGTLVKLPLYFNNVVTIISYILLLYKPATKAIKTLIKNRVLNENALITISCIGAYLVNQKIEGIMVVSLYLLGKILEEKAVNNTRKSIKALINIKQDYANVKNEDDSITKINIEDIKVNDILVVKKGEKVPVDGIVIKGKTNLDTSALTGESEPRQIKEKETILSGSINIDNPIEIKATKIFEDSTVSKIISLISDATDKKANTETLVAKIAKIYTPIVLLLAILVAAFLPLLANITYKESIYRGLTFLVISCPCAIAISVPLTYFTGIGVSSKKGILIKGSNYLDNLSKLNKIIFDKTGTITTGTFQVKKIEILDDKYTEKEIIDIITKGESLSNHPIAKSILKLTNKKINNKDVSDFKEIEGLGIEYTLNNKKIKIGTSKHCNCDIEANIHININNKHIASLTIDDGIKKEAIDCIKELKKLGIKTYMFTGDSKEVSKEIAKRINIDNYKAEMLPTDKYHEYEKISEPNDLIAFVGDGINDAPVLKRADIGISMGSIGGDAAIEASDIIIMQDNLAKIPEAINISKYTNKVIKENLIFAITTKILILILSVFGLSSMWFAVFADTGVTLITILNTLKILKKYK